MKSTRGDHKYLRLHTPKKGKKKQNEIRRMNTNMKPSINAAHQNKNTNYKVP
jgi:hypothetical protein